MADSESENEFEDFFKIKDDDEDEFYFENMTISDYDEFGGTSLVVYRYSLSHEIYFESKIVLNQRVTAHLHSGMLFAIGMCTLTWYWMGFATKSIVILPDVHRNFYLSPEIISFWQNFYRNVLLEFIYLNRMTAADITITAEPHNDGEGQRVEVVLAPVDSDSQQKQSILVPLGGGKDSLVAWHLCQERGFTPVLMYVTDGLFEYDASWRLQEIVKRCGNQFLLVRHDFHDDSFQRHCRSYLNPCGHPWAALVLFDAVLMCSLNGIPLVSLGLELSSDEGNGVFIEGVEVNHQYDKSSVFLALAGQYVREHLSPGVQLESVVKNMWEVEITRLFCTEPRLAPFHPLFISCNEPVNHNTWCANCDKCAFMCLLLSSWLPSEVVVNTVFGGSAMLERPDLLPLFEALIGCGKTKPFDCVGTVDEAKAAVHLSALQYTRERRLSASNEAPGGASALPVVLSSLCQTCGIALSDDGLLEEMLEYQQIYARWGL